MFNILAVNLSFALVGLVFGSFATVLTFRVPRKLSIIKPRSRCQNCGAQLSNLELIPLVSYLALRGRTRCCQAKLNPLYPAIEFSVAILFVISYHLAGFSLALVGLLALAVLTVPLIIIDIQEHRLPNPLTYSGIGIGLLISVIASIKDSSFSPLFAAIILAFVSSLFFFVLNIVSRGGMGMGDVKLAAMLGTFLAPFGGSVLFVAFLIAFLTGAVMGITLLALKKASKKTLIPFGPYMLLGAWLAVMLGNQKTQTILNLWIIN